MRIFVDENIPAMTVEALREAGHDVIDIRGTLDECTRRKAARCRLRPAAKTVQTKCWRWREETFDPINQTG